MPNDSASRYGHAEEPGYEGFHTYATSDLYDTDGGVERWPDNWANNGEPVSADYDDDGGLSGRRDYWPVLLWTMGWYAVPAVILAFRALLLPNTGEATRGDALGELLNNAPLWLMALAGGLFLALVLRWASEAWRAVTIGFCAAVVSGGAVTILYRIW